MEHDHAQHNITFIKPNGSITDFCGKLIKWLTISLSLLTPLILLTINHDLSAINIQSLTISRMRSSLYIVFLQEVSKSTLLVVDCSYDKAVIITSNYIDN